MMGKLRSLNKRALIPTLLDVVLLAALVCAVVYVQYVNFTKLNPFGLDSDYVNEISFRQASWEQKTLYPEGFWNSSESFITRPVLVYWLFYELTKNFLLSFQLENACMFLGELALLYLLIRRYVSVRSVRILCLLMFVVVLPGGIKALNFLPTDTNVVFAYEVLAVVLLRSLLRGSVRAAATEKDKGLPSGRRNSRVRTRTRISRKYNIYICNRDLLMSVPFTTNGRACRIYGF